MSRRNGLLGNQEGFMTHNSKDHVTDVWKLFFFFKTCVWVLIFSLLCEDVGVEEEEEED